MKHFIIVGVVFAAVSLAAGVSHAQQGPAAEHAHLACAGDMARLCPKDTPGAMGARMCIFSHGSQLSDGCKAAIKAVMSGGQPGSASGAPHN